MNHKIKTGSGIITLGDSHYKASGGEGAIYVHNGTAFKLYHEPDKKQLPPVKMKELGQISNSQVVVPQEIIFDAKTGNAIGYTTKFVDDADPLLKLFTRKFKDANNISYLMINRLVKEMQTVVGDVHKSKCLIVDLNELNVLVGISNGNIIPWFIDTDSYSTPSFKATAIMDSVRDRKVSRTDSSGTLHYNPNIESDWFSWSVLAFYLYVNIHPFRGTHPNYKPRDKQKQMDDGISVFHPGVRMPACVNNLSVIPPRHLDWFKQVFLKNERGIPPMADGNVPLLTPSQIVTIRGNDKISLSQVSSYDSQILEISNMMGLYYVATKNKIYANEKEIGNHTAKKIRFCSSDNSAPIIAQQTGNGINFCDLTSPNPIGTSAGKDIFARNNAFFTTTPGKLIENTFISFGCKTIHRSVEIENLSVTSAAMYDGCVIQDLLGKKFLVLPYKLGSCFSRYIPELDGYRVIDARADKNVVVIVGERKGQLDRFVLIYDKTYSKYEIRKTDDVSYNTINFTVMDNGLCVLLATDDELELFNTATKYETLPDPPFDSNMKLFSCPDGLFIINGSSFHRVKRN
jgi:hypothetical protein